MLMIISNIDLSLHSGMNKKQQKVASKDQTATNKTNLHLQVSMRTFTLLQGVDETGVKWNILGKINIFIHTVSFCSQQRKDSSPSFCKVGT